MSTEQLIEWLPWGELAFARAMRDQRPILLRIGASWCASCHLMAAEADLDPYVVSQIREHYIPIYVDSDRRPDINERYNMGGWPTNVFLTPRGELIAGGTFFDIDTFRVLLSRVAQNWVERRSEVEEAVAATRRDSEHRRRARETGSIPTIESVQRIVDLTMDEFDFRFGGFGREPKFPHSDSIELLLSEFCRTGERRLREAALITLDAIWTSDADRPSLADRGGGFFRYATRRDWSEPRFEKMLDENARLISIYLSAHQLTGERHWALAAREAIDYVLATLADPSQTRFYASQAPGLDEEFYELPLEERLNRTPPKVDRTVIVSWNAQMASAFVKAGMVLKDRALLDIGIAVADALLVAAPVRDDDVLLGHILRDDRSEGPILLSSQVFTARALVDCYEAVGGSSRLIAASALMDAVHGRLRDTVRSLYTDTIVELGTEGYLGYPIFPLPENGIAAETLLRLSAQLDSPDYESRASKLLHAMTTVVGDYGFVAAPFALSVLRSLVKDRMVVHLAAGEGHSLEEMAQAAHSVYAPFKTVRFLEPERDRARLRALASAIEAGPVAVVCIGAACAEPCSAPDRLLPLVARVANASFPRIR